MDVEGNVEGFLVCILFPEFDDWQLQIYPAYKTIVVSDLALNTFSILDLKLHLNATVYVRE